MTTVELLESHCVQFSLKNISRCRVQSRYCRDSYPDQGCTKSVQPGKIIEYSQPPRFVRGDYQGKCGN